MRKGSMIAVAAAFLAFAAPAKAQIFMPYGGSGMLTAPEAASGAIGAGAAHSAAQQQQCIQSVVGRGGVQTLCAPNSASQPPQR